MIRHGGSHGARNGGRINNIQLATLSVAGREVGIHFNGDYFLDDDNNVFLQRHPTTRQWFIMVRDGYGNPQDAEDANARIERGISHDYSFGAAWQEYHVMVETVLRR